MFGILPFANLDSLGLGALLAYLAEAESENLKRMPRFFLAAVPVLVLLLVLRCLDRSIPLHDFWQRLAMVFSFAGFIYFCSKGLAGKAGYLLGLPILLYFGRISYGLYVLHNFAGLPSYAIAKFSGIPAFDVGVLGLGTKAIVTIVGASLSWFLLEKPLNSLKRHFPYSR